jgi:hypothetical protein
LGNRVGKTADYGTTHGAVKQQRGQTHTLAGKATCHATGNLARNHVQWVEAIFKVGQAFPVEFVSYPVGGHVTGSPGHDASADFRCNNESHRGGAPSHDYGRSD